MKQVVKRFLEDKADGLIGRGGIIAVDDRLLRYPITYIVNGVLKEGYLQDAIEEEDSLYYHLSMIILSKDKKRIDTVNMNCTAPGPDCKIDWDSVYCVNRVTMDEEKEVKVEGEKF